MTSLIDAKSLLGTVASGIAGGALIPYLGPGVLEVGEAECPVPTSTRGLVERLTQKVGVPGRIRNNLWASAQYIETNRHRVTLVRLMEEIFKPVPALGALHTWLASLDGPPLIIDTWYDATMSEALKGRSNWGQIQGGTRNAIGEDRYYKSFDASGAEVSMEAAAQWTTVLYKPHGSVWPACDLLVSDSDYVEVLTEIDIQTPIPQRIKDLREERGFVFMGCRFYDQMLRTYAKQIMKRSKGPHYAIITDDLTRNELRFLDDNEIVAINVPLEEAVAEMAGAK
jgi:hypothetical protein